MRMQPVLFRPWQARREVLSQRGKTMQGLYRRVRKIIPSFWESSFLQSSAHSQDQPCWDFTWLAEAITESADAFLASATESQSSRMYTLMRLRSQIPLCCMRKSGHLLNCVEFALQKDLSFPILAWSCHGETGMADVSETNNQILAVWLAGLDAPASTKTPADIVDRLVLLVEKGCRIEDPVRRSNQVRSIFRVMLEISQCEPETNRFMDCIIQMQLREMHTDSSSTMRPSLRHFLTGKDLPDHLGPMPEDDTTGWTTALHECVRMGSYSMVEALVVKGFQVNAFDAQGRTAYQYISISGVSSEREVSKQGIKSYEPDRIEALLSQSSGPSWEQHPPDKRVRGALPLGWDRVSLKDHRHSVPDSANLKAPYPDVLYLDRHFKSVTIKPPSFSFFTDQRLALGFRKIHLPGQTYYLDLLRFLQPPTSLSYRPRISKPKFSPAWYEDEVGTGDTEIEDSVAILRLKNVLHGFKNVLQPSWLFLIRVVMPGPPINIYLSCVPLALAAEKWSWPILIRLFVNLVALASLSNLSYTAMVFVLNTFIEQYAFRRTVMAGLKLIAAMIISPISATPVESSVSELIVRCDLAYPEQCLVLMYRSNLSEPFIPFMLAAILWDFYCVSCATFQMTSLLTRARPS
jgi:hypothetical protein